MAQQFLLPCACGRQARVSIAQAGDQVTCECGQRLAVPTLRNIRNLEPATDQLSDAPATNWGPFRRLAFSLSMTLAMIGLAITGYYGLRYAQLVGYSKDLTPDLVKYESDKTEAKLKDLTPADALDGLREMEKEGLGEKTVPWWITAKEKVALYLQWIKIGAVAAGAGALAALLTLGMGKN